MTKANPKTYRTGDDDIFRLFDTGEMEHVCDLIKNCHDPIPKGYRAAVAKSLTEILLRSVMAMVYRLHESGRGESAAEFDATNSFRECIENVSKSLAMSDDATASCAFSKSAAKESSENLCVAWTRFIAHASAHRMYADLPRELEKSARTSQNNSAKAGKPRKNVTKDELETYRYDFVKKHSFLHGWKKSACINFKISGKTLNKRMEE